MLLVLSVLLVVCASNAKLSEEHEKFSVQCSNSSETHVSVSPSADGVEGRYVVRYCAAAGAGVRSWHLVMNALEEPPERCTYETLGDKSRPGQPHSKSFEEFELDLSCPNVCFSKSLDLMFSSCYRFTNQLFGKYSYEVFHSYFYASNNITGGLDFYENASQLVVDFDYDTKVSFHWTPGPIPISDYEISICEGDLEKHNKVCTDVKRNCSRVPSEPTALYCELALPHACYRLELNHVAPWTHGHMRDHTFLTKDFCHKPAEPPEVRLAVPAGVWWAAGCTAVLAVCALAALLTWHSRLARKLRRRVRERWLASVAEGAAPLESAAAPGDAEAAAAGAGAAGARRVLLLYARDCPAAARVVAALRALLRHAAPGQVYDIFSPEVVAAAAPAPAEWVRGALAHPGVRVVLLQTPALRALHAAPRADADHALKLSAPLLPRRVAYRAPHFGDTLLQYALRLMSETHAQLSAPYNKYHIATLSELPVDIFPEVVPYCRYELPGAAALLARDAAGPGAPPPRPELAAELAAAAAALAQHVRDDPDYLADEIMFLA